MNGIRHKVDVIRIQAFVWNVGTLASMIREKLKCKQHKSQSTEARKGGGTARSSEEVLVMRMERRGCRFQWSLRDNLKKEDRANKAKPFNISKEIVLDG